MDTKEWRKYNFKSLYADLSVIELENWNYKAISKVEI